MIQEGSTSNSKREDIKSVPVQNSRVDATFSRESATSIFESSIKKQVQCPLKVVNQCLSWDAVLDFYCKFGTYVVSNRLRLPSVLIKFLQLIQESESAEEFFPYWRSLPGPPFKLQEVVRGMRLMS
ncbi:hypothetical protein Hdeb2414_s0010g00355291 [Helianthus debilis subsp. tardiflorus]